MAVHLKPLPAQTIVITGATSGIGLATARLAAARGARLVLVGRSEHALESLRAEIAAGSGGAVAVTADVTVERNVERVAATAIERFGGFDTWVNNAAVSAYGACLDVSIADMRRIVETNFWGVVYGSRVACAHLRTRGGALINVGSVLSDRAVPLQGAYSASKHAIKGWTDALRVELRHDRAPVSVTLIKPSAIGTPYAEHARNYLADQPVHMPPVYSPRSVARAILYAATHPVRDVVVGSTGRALSLAGYLLPSLTDLLLDRVFIPATHSGRPRNEREALDRPSEDLRERGDYPGWVRGSLYTSLRTHPAAAVVALALAGGLAARQILSAAGTSDRNTDRRAVRAAQ